MREVKEWYIEYLVGVLLEEGDDHEDITAPLLVIAPVSKADFTVKKLNGYSYEVCMLQILISPVIMVLIACL